MYKLHLILKYLRKRRIAWVSLIAVTLCTAMVLVVISVMGGWLRMFRETNHGLIGDFLVFRQSLDGFGHYQEMIDQIERLPEIGPGHAAAEIHTFGLAVIGDPALVYPIRTGVEVVGYDLKQIQNVTDFTKGLYLQPQRLKAMAVEKEKQAAAEDDPALLADAAALRKAAADFPSFDKPVSAETLREVGRPIRGLPGSPATRRDDSGRPGIIVGESVIGFRQDTPRGDWLYRTPITLTVMKVSAGSGLDAADMRSVDRYWIVNDSRTGFWPVDENTVYVPFDILQRDLDMSAYSYTDANTGLQRQGPARCNQIFVKLNRPCDQRQTALVEKKIEAIVQGVAEKFGMVYPNDPIRTQTWEENRADFLSAVEHEEALLVVLFAIISVVAIFLIFCIFYMVVVEKTRDIGIIKSVGATGAGVAGIFLGYGLVIGIIGSGLGLLLGYLVVHNINWLHMEMGKLLHIQIWNAKTYMFDTIPNVLEAPDVVVIVSVAILSSVLGAVIPAIRAARMNPIDALRWE